MRRNVVLAVVFLGFIALGALLLFKPVQGTRESADASGSSATGTATVSKQTNATNTSDKPGAARDQASAKQGATGTLAQLTSKDTNSAAMPDDSPEAKHQAYVEERSAELMDLGMNDDSQSLNTILSELNNRDPEIRKAAVDAAVQFGSRDAIPALMDAANQTDDPKEKAEIMEAVQFLKLPTLTEVTSQANARASAPSNGPPQ